MITHLARDVTASSHRNEGASMQNLTRRQTLAALASALAIPVLPGCATVPNSKTTLTDAEANALLDSVANNFLQLEPELVSTLGLDKHKYAHLWSALPDISARGIKHCARILRDDLARVSAVDVTRLGFETRTSVEVVKSAYRTALEGYSLPYGDLVAGSWRNTPYVVIQNAGAYLDVPRLLSADHPVASAFDAQTWMARLATYATSLDGELDRMRAARAMGLIPPRFLIEKTLTQMQLSAAGAINGGALVEFITSKTAAIPGNWQQQARQILKQQVAPALERQIAELKLQQTAATDDPGMYSRPHGEEYYRWALKASTTTTMSPEEIHQLGLEQLKSLQSRMDPLLKDIGYTQGSIGSRMKALASDPHFQFSEGDEGRKQILAFIQERIDLIRARMPQAFNTLVRGNVEVIRLPPEEEPGAPAAFGGAGSIDGTIPGKFWINLRDTNLHSRYSLPDLVHHEAIPGHVWQGEYTRKLPMIRSMLEFNAYSEGWALYAEQLADELGMYDDYPAGRLGYLQSIAFRACRLVVDTGLHAKQWTREQAVDFFVNVNGSNPLEVASEVDRYCSWPGQACGYEVGHQEIIRQRARAQAALGSRYDLKAFNDTVVLGGNVPLDVLALNVDEYIRKTRM
jgi:uncharacterized protein (DUF885 family)